MQPQPDVAALFGVDARLQRRRRRGQHDWRAFEPRAHYRHVAGVVDDAVFLLVGALVFLIDHDQAEFGERQEQRRAGADDHLRLAAGDGAPQPFALARRHARMPLGRAHAKTLGEAVEKLRRQRNLGHQDQRLASGDERRRDRLEIDLRLAGSGHAFEQEWLERARLDRCAERLRRLGLIGLQRSLRESLHRAAARRVRAPARRLECAVVDEAVDDARAASRASASADLASGPAGERLQHGGARGG